MSNGEDNKDQKNSVNIWVSGAWIHRAKMAERIDELRKLGYRITHDWTQVEQSPNPGPKDQATYAKFDIDGVMSSDIAVAVMDDPDYAYRGTYCELGCALGSGKDVHIVWPYSLESCDHYVQTNVFFWHPNITYQRSWDEFVQYLCREHPVDLKYQ